MAVKAAQVLVSLARLMGSRDLKMRANLATSVILELVGIGFGVAGPFMLKQLVDTLGRPSLGAVSLVGLVILFVVTWFGGSIVSTFRMVFTSRVIDALQRSITTTLLRGRLPAAASARDGDSGRLLGLLERLPFSLQVVCEGLIWRTVPMFVQVFACFAVIAGLIPLRYVLIMGAMLTGFVAATWYGANQQKGYSLATNVAAGAVSQTLGDVLRNARRVVLNGALELEVRRTDDKLLDKRKSTERMWWSLVRLSVMQYGSVGLGLLFLLILGGLDVGAGRMTVGDFVLLQAYAARLTLPLSSFGFNLSQAGVSIANLSDVLDLASPSKAAERRTGEATGAAGIELLNVSFDYGPGLPGVKDVSVSLAPGTFNVIVGPNGSGKSTLAQLIAGVLEPSKGMIRIGGQELATLDRSDRHRQIMYVPQFIGLFHRSLSENALYPPTSQTEGELQELLGEWRFYEAGRPIDFSMMVGEQGERLSGGQIQKLELARLTGVRVPAIILDESTSALDPRSEARVIGTLRKRFGGGTTMMLITHRPQLAEIADQVLFMQAGRLLGAGLHFDLLAGAEAYAALWAQAD